MLDAPRPKYATQLTKSGFYGLFALKHLLKIKNIPRDVPEPNGHTKNAAEKVIEKLETRLFKKIHSESTGEWAGRMPQLPRIRAEDLTPEYFIDTFYNANYPVVIEGLLKGTPAVDKWTLPWFQEKYGHYRIETRADGSLADGGSFLQPVSEMTLKEAVDRMLRGEKTYVGNWANLLLDHPDLVEMLEPQRIRNYLNPMAHRPVAIHMFLGSKGSGSNFHCASGGNMFLMVHGSKRWVVVHPSFTPYMYPSLHHDAIYAASPIDARLSDEENAKAGYTLWKHIPRYIVDLNPGDVLYNPAWWWHDVQNLSPTSIGLAFRVVPPSITAGNPAFFALAMTKPAFRGPILRWMLHGKSYSDEDILKRLFPHGERV